MMAHGIGQVKPTKHPRIRETRSNTSVEIPPWHCLHPSSQSFKFRGRELGQMRLMLLYIVCSPVFRKGVRDGGEITTPRRFNWGRKPVEGQSVEKQGVEDVSRLCRLGARGVGPIRLRETEDLVESDRACSWSLVNGWPTGQKLRRYCAWAGQAWQAEKRR